MYYIISNICYPVGLIGLATTKTITEKLQEYLLL